MAIKMPLRVVLPVGICPTFRPTFQHRLTKKIAALLLALSATLGCTHRTQPAPADDPAVWRKIKIDFKNLDAEGLSGPASGKVAVHYEFCIPADEKHWKTVQAIDPTAQKYPGSSGRVGCGGGTWLVIGSTHQKNYRRVLYDLAALSFVQRIEETFWE